MMIDNIKGPVGNYDPWVNVLKLKWSVTRCSLVLSVKEQYLSKARFEDLIIASSLLRNWEDLSA